jgi:hypothetical protein
MLHACVRDERNMVEDASEEEEEPVRKKESEGGERNTRIRQR